MKSFLGTVKALLLAICLVAAPDADAQSRARTSGSKKENKPISVSNKKQFQDELSKRVERGEEQIMFTWRTAKKKEVNAALKTVLCKSLDIAKYSWDKEKQSLVVKVGYADEYILMNQKDPGILKSVQDRVQATVKTLVKPGMSDFDKVAAVHDWLIANIKHENYSNNGNLKWVFSERNANSEGFCRAAYYMLHLMGIESMRVKDKEDQYKLWNLVNIKGSWYHLDICKDAELTRSKKAGKLVAADYFLLTDDEMTEAGYTWDTMEYPPTETLPKTEYKKSEHSYSNIDEFIEAVTREKDRGQDSYTAHLIGANKKLENYLKQEAKKEKSENPIRYLRFSTKQKDVVTIYFN